MQDDWSRTHDASHMKGKWHQRFPPYTSAADGSSRPRRASHRVLIYVTRYRSSAAAGPNQTGTDQLSSHHASHTLIMTKTYIASTKRQQLLVRTLLLHPPALKVVYPIRMLYRRQSMCDRNGRSAFGSGIERSLNDAFGLAVEGGRGFV